MPHHGKWAVTALVLLAAFTVLIPSTVSDGDYLTDVHSKYVVTFDIPDVANCDHYLIDFGDGCTVDSLTDDTSEIEARYDSSNDTWAYRVTHVYPESPANYTFEFTAFNSSGDAATNGLNVVLLGYPVITFDTRGGSEVPEMQVPNGPSNGGTAENHYYTSAEKPADPSREGYGFEGWFTDTGLTEEWDWDALVTGNMTLYAKWSVPEQRFTITFYVDREPYRVYTYSPGETIVLPQEPAKDGYRFIGWKGYSEGMAATATRGFCAQWESVNPVTYLVSYTIDGRLYSSYLTADGSSKLEDPVKEGCSFEGWYLDEALTTPFEYGSLDSDITLYPKFTAEDGKNISYASAAAAIVGILVTIFGYIRRSPVAMALGITVTAVGIAVHGADIMGLV